MNFNPNPGTKFHVGDRVKRTWDGQIYTVKAVRVSACAEVYLLDSPEGRPQLIVDGEFLEVVDAVRAVEPELSQGLGCVARAVMHRDPRPHIALTKETT